MQISAAYDDEGRRTSMTYPNYYLRENDEFPLVAGRALSYGFDATAATSTGELRREGMLP